MRGAEAEEAAPAVWRLSAEDQSFDHPNNVYQLGDAGPDTTDTECHVTTDTATRKGPYLCIWSTCIIFISYKLQNSKLSTTQFYIKFQEIPGGSAHATVVTAG